MANSFGSLWVGTSGLQSASHGLNTTSNNLSNVNTEGYVREQVVYEDRDYRNIGTASVSDQYSGLGVQVGTIVHARDIFLDKAYRTENGRYSFYEASAEAVEEVETQLQETNGEAFKDAIADFYEAFAEFAKDPSDTVNQNLVLQKASLFLSRATAVDDGFQDYQSIINSKIEEDVDRINEIGEEIVTLNKRIQAIEAGGVEQAMDLRDTRDLLLDELSGLARISYSEDNNSIVHVEIEGVEFVDEVQYNEIGKEVDLRTGYITPYWTQLSDFTDPDNPDYYPVFATETINGKDYLSNVSAVQNSDVGEVKALLMARGSDLATYLDFYQQDSNGNLTSTMLDSNTYDVGIGNSIMMNSEAELDTLIHQMVTEINNLFSPLTTINDAYADKYGAGTYATYVEPTTGATVTLKSSTQICDVANADVGSDEELPPRELFVRTGTDRYTEITVNLKNADGTDVLDESGNPVTETLYVYNEEDPEDTAKCYTLRSTHVNSELVEQESLLPYKKFSDMTQIDYDMGEDLAAIWSYQNFNLNPSDTTPSTYTEFYTKWIGEVGTTGSVYSTTADSLEGTSEQIEYSRQGIIGVSSDEELTSMIKYQQAYNASSRYINVVNEMIEHLLTALAT